MRGHVFAFNRRMLPPDITGYVEIFTLSCGITSISTQLSLRLSVSIPHARLCACVCVCVCARARRIVVVTRVLPHADVFVCAVLFPLPISTRLVRAAQLGSVMLAVVVCMQ